MLRSSLLFSKELWRWNTTSLPDPEPLFLAWQEIGISLSVLFFHLERWATAAWQGNGSSIPLPPACCGAWFSGWQPAGQPGLCGRCAIPWQGWRPLGLLLAFLLNYTGGDIFSLLAFIGCLLLLMAITRLDANELRWLRQHTDYASDIGQDLGHHRRWR